MSHQALQRVIVRMLYDPRLVRHIHIAADAVLADVDLTDEERSWLLTVDPRAFGVDPYRRARSLRALIDEMRASAALATRVLGDVRELDAFFSSRVFHVAIQEGRSLALAFADWLAIEAEAEHFLDARIVAMSRLEAALARLRRTGARPPRPAPRAAQLALSSWYELVPGPLGLLALYQELVTMLRERAEDPTEALLAPEMKVKPAIHVDPDVTEWLLLEKRDDGSVGIGAVTPELAKLLDRARPSAGRDELLAAARELGAERGEDEELVDELVADGLLVAAPDE